MTYDSEGFVRLPDIMNFKTNLQTPTKLLNAVFTNQNARFQLSFPVYRVSGPTRKRFVLPDIGIRATQGHSVRDDVGPGYLRTSQERLNADQKYDPAAWGSIAESHSLIPGGLVGNREAVHFAVSLLGPC